MRQAFVFGASLTIGTAALALWVGLQTVCALQPRDR